MQQFVYAQPSHDDCVNFCILFYFGNKWIGFQGSKLRIKNIINEKILHIAL